MPHIRPINMHGLDDDFGSGVWGTTSSLWVGVGLGVKVGWGGEGGAGAVQQLCKHKHIFSVTLCSDATDKDVSLLSTMRMGFPATMVTQQKRFLMLRT